VAEHIEAIRKDGLALEGVNEVRIRPRPAEDVAIDRGAEPRKERPIDIAFISMKSYDTEWATTMIRQYLRRPATSSLYRTASRGAYCRRGRLGKTVGAIAAILSAELYAPAKIRRTGAKNPPGHEVYRVGEVHGAWTKRIEELGAMIGTIDSCKVTDNLVGRALVETVRQRHA